MLSPKIASARNQIRCGQGKNRVGIVLETLRYPEGETNAISSKAPSRLPSRNREHDSLGPSVRRGFEPDEDLLVPATRVGAIGRGEWNVRLGFEQDRVNSRRPSDVDEKQRMSPLGPFLG
jgi:hypothetical protein